MLFLFLLTLFKRGVPKLIEQQRALLEATKAFFALSVDEKASIRVEEGGVRWRGWMTVGGESTHGSRDFKESLYLGNEHDEQHAGVVAGLPLHGRNRWPASFGEAHRRAVLDYIDIGIETGQNVMSLLSASLGLGATYMRDEHCREPIALVRLVRYPSLAPATQQQQNTKMGIGEHTDHGFLTLLFQDSPGLEFLHPDGSWMLVPPRADCIVVNIGDMFDRMTGGRFVSRRHRVRNQSSTIVSQCRSSGTHRGAHRFASCH